MCFTTELGEPCDPRNALRALRTASKRAGLPSSIGLHTLWHGSPEGFSGALTQLSDALPGKGGQKRWSNAKMILKQDYFEWRIWPSTRSFTLLGWRDLNSRPLDPQDNQVVRRGGLQCDFERKTGSDRAAW
jgi:hypothetical protein